MKIKIAFLSAGLGNISRGFEVSAATWFEELKENSRIEAKLFSGGDYQNATKVWSISRDGTIASFLRKISIIKDGCRLERISFGFGFLWHLVKYKPDIIWLQEGTIGNILLSFREKFNLSYKILFCDGAPIGYDSAKQFDYFIFLHQHALQEAIEKGADIRKSIVIPHLSLFPNQNISKEDARAIFGISPNKLVIICVAAWNKYHKRIDYLLRETAKLGPDVTLMLCGQPEKDSNILQKEAESLRLDVQWRTLTQEQLSVAYTAADIFVLPSLHEGLGVVLIEAGAHGLPIISHPHDGARFILGNDYQGLTDLSAEGNFSNKIREYIAEEDLSNIGKNTKTLIYSKFHKDILMNNFMKFIEKIIG